MTNDKIGLGNAVTDALALFLDCSLKVVLFGSRVVRRVHVIDRPGTGSVDLDHCLARGPGKMLHSCGPVTKGSCRHCPSGTVVQRFAHAEVECPRCLTGIFSEMRRFQNHTLVPKCGFAVRRWCRRRLSGSHR